MVEDYTIAQLEKTLEEAGVKFDHISDKAKRAEAIIREAFTRNKITAEDFNKKMEEVKKSLEFSAIADSFMSNLKGMSLKLQEFGVSSGDLAAGAATILSKTLQDITRDFNSFGTLGKGAEGATAQVSDLVTKLENLGSEKREKLGITDAVFNSMKVFGQARDRVVNLENAFLRNSAAAGKLGGVVGNLSEKYGDITKKTQALSRFSKDVGDATGLESEKVSELFMALDKIPGTMEKNIDTHGVFKRTLSETESVIRIARGTNQDYGVVVEDVKKKMNDYGLSTQKSLEAISKIYSVTQSAGLNLNQVSSYTDAAGDAFKFLGDQANNSNSNLTGSLAVLKTLAPELKNIGLGADAATDLVKGFTAGIAGMDTAQKAFLSGQTGGRGGLLGGLEIEQMMAEGNFAELAEKVQTALEKQVGGRLINRQEAIQGGEAGARQFELQRQLLKQGPFGQLAQTDMGASSLIEALQKGDFGAISDEMAAGQEDMKNVLNDSNAIIDNQRSVLVEGNNILSMFADANNQSLSNIVKGFDKIGRENFGVNIDAASETARQRSVSMADNREDAILPISSIIKTQGSELFKEFGDIFSSEKENIDTATLFQKMKESASNMIPDVFKKFDIPTTIEGDELGANFGGPKREISIPNFNTPETPRSATAPLINNIQPDARTLASNQFNTNTAGNQDLGTIRIEVAASDQILKTVDAKISKNARGMIKGINQISTVGAGNIG